MTTYASSDVGEQGHVSPEDARHLAFGITLDQIDALDRLLLTISAHGDVVANSDAAALARHTLPLLGQVIHDSATAMRRLLDEVEAQRLEQAAPPGDGVREARAAYLVFDRSPESPLAHIPAIASRWNVHH